MFTEPSDLRSVSVRVMLKGASLSMACWSRPTTSSRTLSGSGMETAAIKRIKKGFGKSKRPARETAVFNLKRRFPKKLFELAKRSLLEG